MAQERFWNWRDDDLSFRLNHWLLGIHESGLYRGFDVVLTAGLSIQLNHSQTGYKKILEDKQSSEFTGVYITPQGSVINENEPISLPVSANNTSTERYDLIVASHEYSRLEGGLTASYQIVEGNSSGDIPELPDPSTDVLLGVLRLPANTTSLSSNGVEYLKSEVPDFSGVNERYIKKFNGILGSNLDFANFKITNLADPENDQDGVNKRFLERRIREERAPIATTTIQGIVELATQTETNNGSGNTVVTASTLNGRTASQTRSGISRFATNTEALNAAANDLGISPATLLNFLQVNNYVFDANYVHTDQNFTAAEKERLSELIGNVRGDWRETDSNSQSYIFNKERVPSTLELSFGRIRMRDRNGVQIGSSIAVNSNVNDDIIAQGLLSVDLGNNRIESIDIEENTSFKNLFAEYNHNISSATLTSPEGSESTFRVNFSTPSPDSFYQVQIMTYTFSNDGSRKAANSNTTHNINIINRNYVEFNVNEFSGVFQTLKVMVTCRRMRRFKS